MPSMSLVVLLVASAGGAKVALVERSTLGVSPAEGARLRAQLLATLDKVNLAAELVTPACASRECLTEVARTRGGCVIGVTLVKNRKGLTIDLEAVDAAHVVLQQTFLLTGPLLERSPEAQVFAHQLAGRLVADERPVVERPPPTLEPRPELVAEEPIEVAPPRVAPRVLAVSAAGAGAVAVGLLIASAVVKGNLDSALAEKPVVTTLTRAQAQQQADLANGLLAGGVVGLGVGLALGATAIVLPLGESP